MGAAILTKEQAVQLEAFKAKEPAERTVRRHGDLEDWEWKSSSLSNLTLDEIIRALYIGYKIKTIAPHKTITITDSVIRRAKVHIESELEAFMRAGNDGSSWKRGFEEAMHYFGITEED